MTTPSRIMEASRPTTGAQERNAKIERILKGVVTMRGVTAAVLVDGDGLVTHAQRDFDLSADALGAAVQVALGSAHTASQHVQHGVTSLVSVESRDGRVFLAPLVKGFVLAVVADASALLGSVRYEVTQTVPVLNDLFG